MAVQYSCMRRKYTALLFCMFIFLLSPAHAQENTGSSDDKFLIMWVGGHPDDEHWCVAHLFPRLLLEQGERGAFVVSTKGEGHTAVPTGYALGQVRENEVRCSAEKTGADHIRFLGIWDGTSGDHVNDIYERMVRMIREIQPDIIITHGKEGEYGHVDHQVLSAQTLRAYDDAARADVFPAHIENGLDTWQAKKFYTVVEHNDTDPVTYELGTDVYSENLQATYGDYGESIISQCITVSMAQDWNRCRLSLIASEVGAIKNEDEILTDLQRDSVARTTYMQNWLVIGSFSSANGNMSVDYLADGGGEASIAPAAGAVTGGGTWQLLENGTDYVNFRSLFDRNYETVAYAYGTIISPAHQLTKMHVYAYNGVKVWLNGTLVHENPDTREWDYAHIMEVTLKQGANTVLVKVGAGARESDPDDGPIAKPWGFGAGFRLHDGNVITSALYTDQNRCHMAAKNYCRRIVYIEDRSSSRILIRRRFAGGSEKYFDIRGAVVPGSAVPRPAKTR